jgi:hypothetical protein
MRSLPLSGCSELCGSKHSRARGSSRRRGLDERQEWVDRRALHQPPTLVGVVQTEPSSYMLANGERPLSTLNQHIRSSSTLLPCVLSLAA